MRISVRLFAILRDRAKVDAFDLELGESSTVADALAGIAERYLSIVSLLPRVSTAVNREYVQADRILQDGDELALIPPVSGG